MKTVLGCGYGFQVTYLYYYFNEIFNKKLNFQNKMFQFPEYPALDKKKWKEGCVVKSRNEPHTIKQVGITFGQIFKRKVNFS